MIKTEILSARNLQWANEDGTAINCLVTTNTLHQEVPFTATPYDSEAHGRELFAKCLAGEFGEFALMEPKYQRQSQPLTPLPPEYHRLERLLLEANLENSRQSFRSVVIVWGSLLDNLLDEMLETEALRVATAGGIVGKPPRSLNTRIQQARDLGLIDQEEADRCNHIRKIRNAAAHEWELSLATKDMLTSLRALYEADHSQLLVFHKDMEFLLQQVYSTSCAMLVMSFTDRLSR